MKFHAIFDTFKTYPSSRESLVFTKLYRYSVCFSGIPNIPFYLNKKGILLSQLIPFK